MRAFFFHLHVVQIACFKGCKTTAKLLMERGANPDLRTSVGTASEIARLRGEQELSNSIEQAKKRAKK
jgi:ankyrin repeat protein